jgi:hypothetical protein
MLPTEAMIAQCGAEISASFLPQHAHLFAETEIHISAAQLAQMQAIITAAETVLSRSAIESPRAKGVFFGYDFHLNTHGAQLIEINTNAGGAFLNCLLHPEETSALHSIFVQMFAQEWRLERGDAPLKTLVIIDEQPTQQFLYPEFLLAQQLFQQAGWQVSIADPRELDYRENGVYHEQQKIDLIYNRLTDFSLTNYPALLAAYQARQVVLTPHPAVYARYADKRHLITLSDVAALRLSGVDETMLAVLQRGVPRTFSLETRDAAYWWNERKSLFFKPISGYGAKGAYRGDKLTKRVFEEILQADYVAQQLAPPGEVLQIAADGSENRLKFDVRCYVYDGQIQLIAARLYQGQTTNFRTAGGGFARVWVD